MDTGRILKINEMGDYTLTTTPEGMFNLELSLLEIIRGVVFLIYNRYNNHLKDYERNEDNGR